jgi:hypothetical protein
VKGQDPGFRIRDSGHGGVGVGLARGCPNHQRPPARRSARLARLAESLRRKVRGLPVGGIHAVNQRRGARPSAANPSRR